PDIVLRDPGCEGGLSRAAHREIPYGDRWQRQPLNSQRAAAIRRRAQPHRRTVQQREWEEWQACDGGRSTRPPQPAPEVRADHPSPFPLPRSSPPYVTSASARSASAMPRRNPSFPAATVNGALYATSMVANG